MAKITGNKTYGRKEQKMCLKSAEKHTTDFSVGLSQSETILLQNLKSQKSVNPRKFKIIL